jgi:hypothetical protein
LGYLDREHRKGKMAFRKRIERLEMRLGKRLGDFDKWKREGPSRAALAAMSDEDLEQISNIFVLLGEPEAVLTEQQDAVLQRCLALEQEAASKFRRGRVPARGNW